MKQREFASVAAIRARHLEDVADHKFRGRALRAHEDRAELLAIIGHLYVFMNAVAAADKLPDDNRKNKERQQGGNGHVK